MEDTILVTLMGKGLEAGGCFSCQPSSATSIPKNYISPTDGEFKGRVASACLIFVEDNSARFTWWPDATPTNTNGSSADSGVKLDAGQSYLMEGKNNVSRVNCIHAAAASAARVKFVICFSKPDQ